MGAALYKPINVYKPVSANIGVVDEPFEYLTVAGIRLPLPFTTRMTVVRLSNGDLFLHAEIRFMRDLDLEPPDEWRNELDQVPFPGMATPCSIKCGPDCPAQQVAA